MIGKLRLISKLMISQTVQQIVIMHILPNISTRKNNQAMKFGKLIKNKARNIFLEKSCSKYGVKLVTDPFLKKSNLGISFDL